MFEYELNGKTYTEDDLINMAGGKDKLPAYIKSKGFKPKNKKTTQPAKQELSSPSFGFDKKGKYASGEDQFAEINKTKKKKIPNVTPGVNDFGAQISGDVKPFSFKSEGTTPSYKTKKAAELSAKQKEIAKTAKDQEYLDKTKDYRTKIALDELSFKNPNDITYDVAKESVTETVNNLNKKLNRLGLEASENAFGDKINIKKIRRGEIEFSSQGLEDETGQDFDISDIKGMNAFVAKLGDNTYAKKIKEVAKTKYPNLWERITPAALSEEEKKEQATKGLIEGFKALEKSAAPTQSSMTFGGAAGSPITKDTFENPYDYELYKQWKKNPDGFIELPKSRIDAWDQVRKEKFINRASTDYARELNPEDRKNLQILVQEKVNDTRYAADSLVRDIDTYKQEEKKYYAEVEAYKKAPNPETLKSLKAKSLVLIDEQNDIGNRQKQLQKDSEYADTVLAPAITAFGANYNRLSQLANATKSTLADVAIAFDDVAAYGSAMILGKTHDEIVKDDSLGLFHTASELNKKQQQYQKSVGIDEIRSLDDAGNWLMSGTINALPSIGMAFTGSAALPLFFASGYGGKANQMAIEVEDAKKRLSENYYALENAPDNFTKGQLQQQITADENLLALPEYKKFAAKSIFGGAEVGFEMLGTLKILNGIGTATKMLPKKTIKEGLLWAGKNAVKNFNTEGLSEFGTTVTDNFADIYILGQNKNLFEGGLESYTQGGLMGTGLSGIETYNVIKRAIVSELANKSENRKMQDIANKISELTGVKGYKLDQSIPLPMQTPVVQKLVDELVGESQNVENNIINRLGVDLTIEQATEIGNINKQLRDINKDFSTAVKDPDLKPEQLKTLESYYKGKFGQLINEREVLLSGKAPEETIEKTFEAIDKEIATDVGRTRKAAEVLGLTEGIDVPELDTANDVIDYLSQNTNLDEDTINDVANKYGAFIPLSNGKEVLIINKEEASMDQVVTTGQHEFLHKLIYKSVKDNPELQKKIGTDLYNHIENYIGTEELNNTEFKERYDGYKLDYEKVLKENNARLKSVKEKFDSGEYSKVKYDAYVEFINADTARREGNYLEETLPLLSESLAKGDIKYNETFFTKIGDILRRIFQKYGLSKVKFETGKDVFNFVRDYNKSFEKGEFTKAFKKLAQEGKYKGSAVRKQTTAKTEVKKSQPVSQVDSLKKQLKDIQDNEFDYDPDDFDQQVANLQNKIKKAIEKEKTAIPVEAKKEITDEEADKEIVKNERGSVSSDRVQKIYDDKGINGAQDIIDLFKPITKKLVNRRMDAPGFDRELLTDEIETGTGGILDLITKYKPEGGVPLAAFINKYLPVRAIAASRRVLDKDFSKDVTEEKGLIAEETASEVKEKPKYKNALESKVFEPEALETAKNKIITVVRTLKSKIDEPVSLNRTVTPIIAEIRDEIGKQLDIDLKTAMGGKKDDQLKKWLLKNKRYILENMTTTWLMGKDGQGGIPQAIQKQVDGKWINYPDWVGKKIDRETTSTDLAGRTSGAELVRRLPNVANNVSESDYLSQILEPTGNPIRGRKESLAKAIAEESAFDIINKDFEEEGPIFDAFKTNQERLGAYLKDNVVNEFAKQAERGNIKFSKKIIKGFQLSQEKLGKDISSAPTFADEVTVINNWIASDGRSIRTLAYEIGKGLKQFTTNKGLFENIILPIVRTYSKFEGIIGKDSYRLNGVEKGQSIYFGETKVPLWQDTTAIKYNWENFIDTINAEAEEATDNLIDIVKYFKNNNYSAVDLDSYMALLRWDQRGLIRKVSKAGLAVLGMNRYQRPHLEHNVPVQNIVERTMDFFNDKISEKELREFIGDAQVNLVPNELNKYLPAYEEGVNRMHAPAVVLYMQSLIDKGYTILNIESEYGSKAKFDALVKLAKSGVASKENTQNAINIDAINSSLTVKYSKTPKGISVFDFDDTVGLTKSNVLYTKPDETTIYHGGTIKGLKDISGPLYVATDKAQAEEYSKGNKGAVKSFVIKTDEIVDEDVVIDEINALGLKSKDKNYEVDELNLYELIDPNFDTSLSDKDLNTLFNSLKQKGIKAVEFLDMNLTTLKNDIYNIVILDKNIVQEQGKLTGEEFAKEGTRLLEEGAVFDFSEFSKVVDGKPGPMVEKMKKMISKFGPENFFILTARPANAAEPIHEFLTSIGIDIPLENITGLGNSAAQAKADWMVAKAAEGYNDFYFADDAPQNVKAVQDALDVLDVKSKIQQAKLKFSKTMSTRFNEIIEENKGVESYKVFSDITARRRGLKKNRFDFYVPPSAADFELLLYKFMGKGALGEEQKKFFDDALLKPYINGVNLMDAVRQSIKREYKALLKSFPEIKKELEKLTPNKDFTYDQAIRVAIWNQFGIEIPGLSQRDQTYLSDLVNNDPDLAAFKDGLIVMGRQKDGWLPPGTYWDADTIVSDLYNITEGSGRKKFLGEFIENTEELFGTWSEGRLVGPNMNKIEAVYGTNVREALEDSIYRMINGKNRSYGQDKETTAWNSWVNGSTGSIMFLNTRSAALQMLGAVNFLNWRDNNPYNAGKAFLNQPQYWKDFARIWNSDKLKERRGGLREDVASAEIANAAAGSKNKVVAVTSYLLKIGYTPTQIADSFAIASGGAPFYRNRIISYQSEYEGLDANGKLKRKYTDAEAEAKAWQDFSKISDETQQSGDPKDISKQQSSAAGRILLVFQNFTMQQSRIVKKAVLDLKNGRGDAKTNIAKIAYYLAVQNIMFSTLQQGLFAAFFDDDEEEDKKKKTKSEAAYDVANGVLDSILRGTGFIGGIAATLKNTIVKYMEEAEKKQKAEYAKVVLEFANMSPPIGSKLRKTYSALQQTKYDKDLIKERGWGVMQDGRVHLGPMYSVSGKLVEVGTNFPMDRLVNKVENISQAFNSDNTAVQRIATGLGYSPWTVGIEGTKGDLKIKAEAKEKRKEEGIIKAKQTRKENAERLKDSIKGLSPEEQRSYRRGKALERREKRVQKASEKREERRKKMEMFRKLNANK